MEHSAGLRKIARLDCAGGGQVVVDGQFAYIGHMDPGVGTSIADGALQPVPAPEMSAFIWFVHITDESHPVPVSSFQDDGLHGTRHPDMTGCHQPVETITGSDVPVAWFSQGLRIIDFSNPMRPHQTACYIPEAADPQKRVSSNDVFVDSRGLLYLIDRMSGLTILERT
jgi:hypothetical protein